MRGIISKITAVVLVIGLSFMTLSDTDVINKVEADDVYQLT